MPRHKPNPHTNPRHRIVFNTFVGVKALKTKSIDSYLMTEEDVADTIVGAFAASKSKAASKTWYGG